MVGAGGYRSPSGSGGRERAVGRERGEAGGYGGVGGEGWRRRREEMAVRYGRTPHPPPPPIFSPVAAMSAPVANPTPPVTMSPPR